MPKEWENLMAEAIKEMEKGYELWTQSKEDTAQMKMTRAIYLLLLALLKK